MVQIWPFCDLGIGTARVDHCLRFFFWEVEAQAGGVVAKTLVFPVEIAGRQDGWNVSALCLVGSRVLSDLFDPFVKNGFYFLPYWHPNG